MAYRFRAGTLPFFISIPHLGSHIPPDIAETMTPDGLSSRDTDWYLDRLYDLPELKNASFIASDCSRYVIDLNRPVSDESLYPGQTTTGLIPTTCFDGSAIYVGNPPNVLEAERRIAGGWKPYHSRLQAEVTRLKQIHGMVVLLEAHSIASVVPRLFDGKLPDFNIGTVHETSCDRGLSESVMSVLQSQSEYSVVLNGRFVGGYITRAYGQPSNKIHALQIELSQSTYLNEKTQAWEDAAAARVQNCISRVVRSMLDWVESEKHAR